MLDLVLIAVAVLTALYWLAFATRRPRNFPPGPSRLTTLPVLGNVLSVGENTTEGYARMRKNYGDVFGFYMGHMPTVVVHTYDLIQKASVSEDVADRPYFDFLAYLRGGALNSGGQESIPGVLMSNGPLWSEQRRSTLHMLRNLGLGKNLMEDMMAEEVGELSKALESTDGRPADIKNLFNIAVLNSLWKVISNERLPYDDPKLNKMVKLLNVFLQEWGSPLAFFFMLYPRLSRFLDWVGYVKGLTCCSTIMGFINGAVADHEATYEDANLRDFIDYYIKAIRERSDDPKESSFKGKEGKVNLINVMVDLFMGGSESTSTTLNWGMLYMLNNPEVQKKVQRELDGVTGRARMPGMADREKTPYTEAVIHEIQRCSKIINLPFRAATRDTTLGGYSVPKGALIFFNVGEVMNDPEHFPNPERFDPTRFLDAEGKFAPDPRVIPFGLGKRRCLGETLARMSLYMFFAGLLSRFDLKKAEDGDVLTEKPKYGGTLAPQDYLMRFVPRA